VFDNGHAFQSKNLTPELRDYERVFTYFPLMFPNRKPSHVTEWWLAIRDAVAAPCSLSANVDSVLLVFEDKSAEPEERRTDLRFSTEGHKDEDQV
jgi:hypothetical protein